jgi:amino acid transporter
VVRSAAATLMLVAGATVDALIPFYAIGVFTGFAMAGFGMARYHRRTREPGWRRRLVINLAGGVYTALVVLLFAVVKFTEGAWLIVIIFPVLVFALIRRTGSTETRPSASPTPATAARGPSRLTTPAGSCCCLSTAMTWRPSRR